MFKTILVLVIVLTTFTLISVIVPDVMTANIDAGIQYFVTYLWGLDGWIHVPVLLDCIQLLCGYVVTIGLVLMIGGIVKLTGGVS